MYTDDNNGNNDKDMKKKKIYTINDKKQWASKPSTSPNGKIIISQGFISGNWGIRVIAPLIFDLFVLLSNCF